MRRKQLLLLSLILLCLSTYNVGPLWAATINAASCSRNDVGTAVASASNGDTVVVPAGICTWATQLNVTVGITLKGAGIDQTTIVDGVPKDGSSNSSVISFIVNAPNTFRITGFTFQENVIDPNVYNRGMVVAYGTAKAFRIDHNKFVTTSDQNSRNSRIRLDGWLYGVIDHNTFRGNFETGVTIGHSSWGGSSYGDGSWAEQLYLGTEKAVYVEDNIFTELANPYAAGAIDGLDGMRFVFRYNTLYDQYVVVHGTDSGQRRRGTRSFEIYNNQFNYNSTQTGGNYWTATLIRSGSGVIYNNTYTNTGYVGNGTAGFNNIIKLWIDRDDNAFPPWGKCDGTSIYDQLTPGASGYRCVDQPGAGTSSNLAGLGTPLAQWVGNILFPIYQWGNHFGNNNSPTTGTQGTFAALHLQANRDYFDNTPKPGYTAYTYPHPLVSGSTTPPSPPVNLRVQ